MIRLWNPCPANKSDVLMWRKWRYSISEKQKLHFILLPDRWFNCTLNHFICFHAFCPRCLRAFLPRGLPTVFPNSDKLHVRCCETLHPSAAGLHRLPVASARRGRNRDTSVLRCSRATQRTGAAARPAYPHWAAHQWQGTVSIKRLSIHCTCELTCPLLGCNWFSWGDLCHGLWVIFQTIYWLESVCIIKSTQTFLEYVESPSVWLRVLQNYMFMWGYNIKNRIKMLYLKHRVLPVYIFSVRQSDWIQESAALIWDRYGVGDLTATSVYLLSLCFGDLLSP